MVVVKLYMSGLLLLVMIVTSSSIKKFRALCMTNQGSTNEAFGSSSAKWLKQLSNDYSFGPNYQLSHAGGHTNYLTHARVDWGKPKRYCVGTMRSASNQMDLTSRQEVSSGMMNQEVEMSYSE